MTVRHLAALALAAACLAASSASAQAPPAPVTDLGPGLSGVFYPPPKPGGPTVLVLGGSEGGFLASGNAAKALSEAGFAALAISYFKAPGQKEVLEEIPLETFTRAIDWIAARPETGRRRIALLGVSKGAEAGLIVAAGDRRICAVIAAVPASVAWQSVNPATFGTGKSSWTAAGSPVPYARYDFSRPTGGIRSFYDGGFAKAPAESVIPVEKIAGPIFLVSGGKDELWPSTPMAEAIVARLDASKVRYTRTHLAYPEAGHGAFGRPLPADDPRIAKFTPAQAANQASRTDAWPKAVAFLRTSLAGRDCR